MQQDIEIIDNHRPDLRQAIEAMPASRLLGLKVIGFGPGVSLLELPIRGELTVEGHVVQGGIVGTLADYAAVSAATAAMPVGWASATTGIELHNLAPARGRKLVAFGAAIRSGKGASLGEARVFAEDEDPSSRRLVAIALASCRVFDASQAP